jgi:uncharacterized membrane protein YedE/YeeE
MSTSECGFFYSFVMNDWTPEQLQHLVVAGAFVLAFVFGFIGNKTHFCTMGAVADIINMGDWSRMRMWVLAIAVAILGVGLLNYAGLIDIRRSIYTQPTLPLLSLLLGGLLFGFGMVLASGCGSKTLIRIGQGNLKSLVVFLAMGLSALAAMRGVFSVLRRASVDQVQWTLPTTQDLPSLLAQVTGLSAANLGLALSIAIASLLIVWVLLPRAFRESGIRSDIVLGGVVVGAVVVAGWFMTGSLAYMPEDPDTLQERYIGTNSGTLESFTFTAPMGYTLELLTRWNDSAQSLTFAIAAVLGMVTGSTAYAVFSRSFRWEGFRNVEDTANHLVGGLLMGLGGVMALGCTVGQGISGFSTLALGSVLAFVAIIAGAIAGLRYQLWRLN